jgi:hypothetical protein
VIHEKYTAEYQEVEERLQERSLIQEKKVGDNKSMDFKLNDVLGLSTTLYEYSRLCKQNGENASRHWR